MKKAFNSGKRKQADARQQKELVKKYFDQADLDHAVDGSSTGLDGAALFDRIKTGLDEVEYRQSLRRKRTLWMTSVSAAAVLIIAGFFFYINYQPVVNKEVATAANQLKDVVLPDGSKVWLNSDSRLTFTEPFKGDKREVNLQGEAFFDVKHDAAKPFIVHTGKVSTQVLGTSFNVKAYSGDDVLKVDVLTGKVGVLSNPKNGTVMLTPNQEAIYKVNSAEMVKNPNADVATLISWRDGKLIFKNQPLGEVVATLQRRFSVRIIVADKNLNQCLISANFTDVSLDNILHVIKKLIRGDVKQKASVYYLKGRGC